MVLTLTQTHNYQLRDWPWLCRELIQTKDCADYCPVPPVKKIAWISLKKACIALAICVGEPWNSPCGLEQGAGHMPELLAMKFGEHAGKSYFGVNSIWARDKSQNSSSPMIRAVRESL